MISDLIKLARDTLTEGLLRLSERPGVSVSKHREILRKAVDDPELFSELLFEPLAAGAKTSERFELISELMRLEPYAKRVLADRYWLEDALEHKDDVMSYLDQRRGQETAQGAFRSEFDQFTALAGAAPRLPIRAEDINPQLRDRASVTPIDRHYIYHPAWAARVLAKTRPAKHVDISSIVSFATIISAFVPVDFYDFRPAPVELDGLYTGAADLTQLPFASNSIYSLSCMHVLEHIGLGRYGDPLDPDGDLKAIGELVRVLAPRRESSGRDAGRPSARRIQRAQGLRSRGVRELFAPLELIEFAMIRERGEGGLFWRHRPTCAGGILRLRMFLVPQAEGGRRWRRRRLPAARVPGDIGVLACSIVKHGARYDNIGDGWRGFIGGHIVHELVDLGESAVVLDKLSTGFRAVPATAQLVVGDIGDGALVANLLSDHRVQAIVQRAASSVVPEPRLQPLGLLQQQHGRLFVVESSGSGPREIFRFSSTAAVYGNPPTPVMREDMIPQPMSPYGASKHMTERMLQDAASASSLTYVVLRDFNVAGADPKLCTGQSTRATTHPINIAIQTALGVRDCMAIFGTDYPTPDGICILDYIHVSDLSAPMSVRWATCGVAARAR